MSIGKIVGTAVNAFSKLSTAEKVLTGVCTGTAGYVVYKACTAPRKSQREITNFMNYITLASPILNPIGCWAHMLNPNLPPQAYDGIAKFMVERNEKRYQEYYDKLSQADKVKEFYANGGRGVIFDA